MAKKADVKDEKQLDFDFSFDETNRVEGFNPLNHLERNKEGKLFLPFHWRKYWFRLKNPDGVIRKKYDEDKTERSMAVNAYVYTNKKDDDNHYVAEAFAKRWYSESSEYSQYYSEVAETAAENRALIRAGFGTQFCTDAENPELVPEEPEPKLPAAKAKTAVKPKVAAAKTATETVETAAVESIAAKSTMKTDTEAKATQPTAKPTTKAGTGTGATKPTAKAGTGDAKSTAKPESTGEKTVREKEIEAILSEMAYEEAKAEQITVGYLKGKSVGQVVIDHPEKFPSKLKWLAEEYNGPNLKMVAAVRFIIQFADSLQQAS